MTTNSENAEGSATRKFPAKTPWGSESKTRHVELGLAADSAVYLTARDQFGLVMTQEFASGTARLIAARLIRLADLQDQYVDGLSS